MRIFLNPKKGNIAIEKDNEPIRKFACLFFHLFKEHDIDLVIHGDDFSEEKKLSQYAVPIKLGIFRTVPYTPGISTTEILSRINSRY